MSTRQSPAIRAAAIIASAMIAAHCGKAAVEEVETSAPLTVQVEPAALGDIQTSIAVTGTIAPAPGADWTIVAPDTARVAELPRAEGDAVKAGDLLVRFEVPSLTADVTARDSELRQAGARLDNARAAATRLAGLVDRGIAAQRELDDARREQQEAEAAVRQAESARAAAQTMVGRLIVRARFAGVVARRFHNPGDQVEASSTDPVLRIVDPRHLEVIAAVPTSQLGQIAPGRPATIVSPSDGAEFSGTVVARPAAVDPAAATGDVRVALKAPDLTFTVGMPVQLRIDGASRTHVLVVAASAVHRDGDETFVVIAGDDAKAHHRPVTVGLSTHDKVQIVSGLTAGDKVIVSGTDAVPDGAPITIEK